MGKVCLHPMTHGISLPNGEIGFVCTTCMALLAKCVNQSIPEPPLSNTVTIDWESGRAVEKPVIKPKPGVFAMLSKAAPMKNGDIRDIPSAASPMFTAQWAVQGTAVKPYIVTRKPVDFQGKHDWQCSCPNWTKNTPRTDCKHIVAVKKKMGVLIEKTVEGLSQADKDLFEKFKKSAAAADATKVVNPFAATSRRFK